MIADPQRIVKQTSTVVHRFDALPAAWTQILPGEIRRWSLEFVPDSNFFGALWITELDADSKGYQIQPGVPVMLEFAKQLDWLSNSWWVISKAVGAGLFVVESLILGNACTVTPAKETSNVP